MSMTIAETRIDELQSTLRGLLRAEERHLPAIERELTEIRKALELASEAIYNATFYDPEGERVDA